LESAMLRSTHTHTHTHTHIHTHTHTHTNTHKHTQDSLGVSDAQVGSHRANGLVLKSTGIFAD